MESLRDRLWHGLVKCVEGVHVNGAMAERLPQNLNVRFDSVRGEMLLKALAGDIAVSSGAACATASAEPSHVLRALGLSDEEARASIRFGLSRFTTEVEVDATVTRLGDLVRQLRKQAC